MITNKIFSFLLGAAGSVCRKLALLLVGYLVQYGFFKSDEIAEQAAVVFAALLYGLMEYGIFAWRTRNGKALQQIVDPTGKLLRHDGINGLRTVAQARRAVRTAPNH